MITKDDVLKALSKVDDPELHRNIVELNMVREVNINKNGEVSFKLFLTTPGCPLREKIAGDARNALFALEGVNQVSIQFEAMKKEEVEEMFRGLKTTFPDLTKVNKIKQVIAVMSGKGGVGKSLVTSLLAVQLANQKCKVGILDADITGPSIPKIFGIPSGGLRGSEQGVLPAFSEKGIKIVSTNLLLKDESTPTIWRGPIISGTITQFWNNTIWGNLDVLLVDLPPGTSDAALTVMQSLPVSGTVLVTTPQELATMVVRKAIHMVQMLKVPIISVVENMSSFRCPDCGKEHFLFGSSHLDKMLADLDSTIVVRLPIDPDFAVLSDTGRIENVQRPEMDPLVEKIKSLSK